MTADFYLQDILECKLPPLVAIRDPEGHCVDFDASRLDQLADLSEKTRPADSGIKGPSVRANIEATRSGVITNLRVYPAVHVMDGAKTFLSPYPKPVLKQHPKRASLFSGQPDQEQAIGRVVSADYKPIWSGKRLENDYKRPHQNGKPGSGFIDMSMRITDEDAMHRVLQQAFLTMSTGQFTDAMNCSVCGTNWKTDGLCEHQPGDTYLINRKGEVVPPDHKDADKARPVMAFLVTGSLQYDHIAEATRPAQPLAAIYHAEMQDELEDVLPDLEVQRGALRLFVGDSQEFELYDEERFEALSDEEKLGRGLTVVGFDRLPGRRQPSEPMGDDEFALAHVAASILDSGAKIEYNDDLTEDSIQRLISILEASELTGAQLSNVGLDSKGTPCRFTREARASLSSRLFHGPHRTFPVPDACYYRAAMRLVDLYRGPGDRDAIKESIIKRGVVLGCVDSSKSDQGDDMAEDTHKKGSEQEPEDTKRVDDGQAPEPEESEDQGSESKPETDTQEDLSELNRDQLVAKYEALRASHDSLEREHKALVDENAKLTEASREILADAVLIEKQRKGRKIKEGDREKLLKRSLTSLRDSLTDLQEEVDIDTGVQPIKDPSVQRPEGDSAGERKPAKSGQSKPKAADPGKQIVDRFKVGLPTKVK